MASYKIQRWDAVMFGSSITKSPMIYIKPDLPFLNFIKQNNYVVLAQIKDSNTIYDGKNIPGVVYRSCQIPNCRPNYFDETGFYTITLSANWHGYPNQDTLGYVSFQGLNDNNNQKEQKEHKKEQPTPKLPIEHFAQLNNNTKKGMNLLHIFIICGVLLVFLMIILIFRKHKLF